MRPRWRFGSFAAEGKGTRRPQAAKFPLRETDESEPCPLIRPSVRTGAPSPQGEGFRAATWGRPYGEREGFRAAQCAAPTEKGKIFGR